MALSQHHAAASRPMSISEITAQAEQFEFTPHVRLQRWIRAAKLLLTQASICEQDGDLQLAYLYLYRHAQLVLSRLPTHPDYRDPYFKNELSAAKRAVMENLQRLEDWKPEIQRRYDRYQQAVARRDAERERSRKDREGFPKRVSIESDEARRGSIVSEDGCFDDDDGRTINANENRELAVDLAHREIRRRDATRQTTWQAGISPATVASRRRGMVVDPSEPYADGDFGVREVASYLPDGRRPPSRRQPPATRPTQSQAYNYPTVPSREDKMDWGMPALQPASLQRPITEPPPARPAKERFDAYEPPLPPKQPEYDSRVPTLTPEPPLTTSLAATSSKTTFKPTAFTESGKPLRTVLLPPDLRRHFLNLAHANTARSLETCGILGATLVSNALFISHLIIPDQTSTSDTCDTTEVGDNELFDYCINNDLLVCGWIHTHPTQTCFLSSRDLHTSSGYQVMLPEAIAIVCAPRHNPDWGIFRLTDPPGLQAVLGCMQTGLFHPHAESNLYTDALRPGHVVEAPGLKFEVVDLRRK